MRLANCSRKGDLFAAVIEADGVHPLLEVRPIGAGVEVDALMTASRGDAVPINEVQLHAPVVPPGKVICLGLNYRDHVTETKRELPSYPVLFTKFSDAIIGPQEPILAPPESQAMDYEAELAVVIGRAGRRVSPDLALELVAGYSVANDVTMRDYQYKSHQWLQGKAWPRSTPIGPYLVTGDEIDDARSLDIRLELNGTEMQRSSTSQMIFDVPTTIATISEFVNLEPGDVVLMGTPGGVGYRRDPKILLRPGDRLLVEIEGIGSIVNEVIAEDV
jgi:acylpyruvate hydrolase